MANGHISDGRSRLQHDGWSRLQKTEPSEHYPRRHSISAERTATENLSWAAHGYVTVSSQERRQEQRIRGRGWRRGAERSARDAGRGWRDAGREEAGGGRLPSQPPAAMQSGAGAAPAGGRGGTATVGRRVTASRPVNWENESAPN